MLADRLKLPFLKTNRILPISFDGHRLLIATADPFVDEAAKAISYMLEVRVDLAVIAPAEIERALRTLYQDAGGEAHADVGEDCCALSATRAANTISSGCAISPTKRRSSGS